MDHTDGRSDNGARKSRARKGRRNLQRDQEARELEDHFRASVSVSAARVVSAPPPHQHAHQHSPQHGHSRQQQPRSPVGERRGRPLGNQNMPPVREPMIPRETVVTAPPLSAVKPTPKAIPGVNQPDLHSDVNVLAQRLRQELRRRPSTDKDLQTLRLKVRDGYERLLFEGTYEESAAREIEQTLWKLCFYRNIEEQRRRLRKQGALCTKGDRAAKTLLASACQHFRAFLSTSTRFYLDLVRRLSEYYCLPLRGLDRNLLGLDPQRDVDAEDDSDYEVDSDPNRNTKLGDKHPAIHSVHRCLIFLGDLARYHRDLIGDAHQKIWKKAAVFYSQALLILPSNGNPHNQLAVLATYNDDEALAVYRYLRSLSTDVPFLTAVQNLRALFEKNKVRWLEEFQNREQQKDRKRGRGRNSARTKADQRRETVRWFLLSFVHVVGSMFGEEDVSTLSASRTALLKDLAYLIKPLPKSQTPQLDWETLDDANDEEMIDSSGDKPVAATETANQEVKAGEAEAVGPSADVTLSYDGAADQNSYKRVALRFVIDLGSCIISRVSMELDAEDRNRSRGDKISHTIAALMPTVAVFCEWLEWLTRTNDTLFDNLSDVQGGERRAFAALFRNMCSLLNHLANQNTRVKPHQIEASTERDPSLLPEQLELRGFVGLPYPPYDGSTILSQYPSKSLDDRELLTERRSKLLACGVCLASLECVENAKFLYYCNQRGMFSTEPFEDLVEEEAEDEAENEPMFVTTNASSPDPPKKMSSSFSFAMELPDDLEMRMQAPINDDENDCGDEDDEDSGLFKPGEGARVETVRPPPAAAQAIGTGRGGEGFPYFSPSPSVAPTSTAAAVAMQVIDDEDEDEVPEMDGSETTPSSFQQPSPLSPREQGQEENVDDHVDGANGANQLADHPPIGPGAQQMQSDEGMEPPQNHPSAASQISALFGGYQNSRQPTASSFSQTGQAYGWGYIPSSSEQTKHLPQQHHLTQQQQQQMRQQQQQMQPQHQMQPHTMDPRANPQLMRHIHPQHDYDYAGEQAQYMRQNMPIYPHMQNMDHMPPVMYNPALAPGLPSFWSSLVSSTPHSFFSSTDPMDDDEEEMANGGQQACKDAHPPHNASNGMDGASFGSNNTNNQQGGGDSRARWESPNTNSGWQMNNPYVP